MGKRNLSNQVLCVTLCALISLNAFVWTRGLQNNYETARLAALTDQFKQEVIDTKEKSRRTLTTNLLTIDAFTKEVTALFEEGNIPEGVAAMIAFDGDGFGKMNEMYGAATVNRLSVAIARTVNSFFPDSPMNIVTNVGEKSDEFYMLLLGRHSREALTEEIEAFQQAVREITVKTSDGITDISGTISIGIAFWHEGESFETLFEAADEAGYAAKEAGKDCYRIAEE